MESFVHQVRRYRWLVLLLLSGFVVPVLTNLVSSWLEQAFGQNPTQLIQLLAIGFAIAVALGVLYLILREERRRWVLVPSEQQPSPCPGLVVLVGPGRPGEDPLKGPVGPAIDHHLVPDAEGQPQLKVCWLVASDEGLPVALALRERYKSRCRVLVRQVHQAFDVQETYEAIQDIYLNQAPAQGLTPQQVIADFTGGTKMMTAGMVLACGDRWPMQYMTGRKEGALSTPILVRFQDQTRRV